MQKFDFENSIGFIINRTGKMLIQAFDHELRKNFGITFGQWKIIITLVNNDDGLTQKEIADKLGLEGATLIPIIDKLEKDGFVVRKVDKNDRRNNRIFLTEKTTSALDLMVNCGIKIKNMSMKDISEQNISITKDTLEKMWKNIQNEFNMNQIIGDKQKRNSTTLGTGFDTDIK
jgi:MarR family transcriptional regulator, transcriptional regulator for hemolysin